MGNTQPSDQPTVADLLVLPPFLDTTWEFLTVEPDLDRRVRWVHTIGVPRPAPLLQGEEFVLSTLPRFTEDTDDLLSALRAYLADLDAVNASALAVEVLDDRPHLLEALRTVVAQRELSTRTAALPIILFTEEVRFVDITEHLHRSLLAHQRAEPHTTEAHDPLFEASTQFIRDVTGGRSASTKAAAQRAQVLGIAGAPGYTSLLLRFQPPTALEASEHIRAQRLVTHVIRDVASQLRMRVVVGEVPPKDLAIIVASPRHSAETDESTFCLRLHRAASQVPPPDYLPGFTISAAEPSPHVREAVLQLPAAQQVMHSLEVVLGRAGRFPGFGSAAAARGYWTADDLGVLGLLARVQDAELIAWFTSAQLDKLRGSDAAELREIVRALASNTGTKADLAAQLGMSRPTLYARMHRLERAIGKPLHGDTLTALHLALLLEDLHD